MFWFILTLMVLSTAAVSKGVSWSDIQGYIGAWYLGIRGHIDAWHKYVKADIKAIAEDPEILAGREAEDLLRNIVDEHYQFKGCHSFLSKRIYNPSVGHKRDKYDFAVPPGMFPSYLELSINF